MCTSMESLTREKYSLYLMSLNSHKRLFSILNSKLLTVEYGIIAAMHLPQKSLPVQLQFFILLGIII